MQTHDGSEPGAGCVLGARERGVFERLYQVAAERLNGAGQQQRVTQVAEFPLAYAEARSQLFCDGTV